MSKQNIKNMETFTLKSGSRIDTSNGYIITSRDYLVRIVKELKFNFVVIKIGTKTFKTDRFNLI